MTFIRKLGNLLLSTDKHQRLRIAQAGLACLLMFLSVLSLHLAAALDLVDRGPLWWWSGASMLGVFTVLGLIRSGITRRLADPSLTTPQMLYAVLCAAWAYSFAGSVHSMVALILAVILMFGMFGLSNRQALWVCAYALIVFGTVMAVMSRRDPVHYPPEIEFMHFWMLIVMHAGVGVLTLRLHGLRDRLRTQKAELKAAVDHIQRLASHDELTGLVNRRRMQELLETERLRAQRMRHPWCIALIDLDHFKRINDEYGHAAGDEVLRALGSNALALVRKTDVLSRWGGEEFVLMLPNTPLGQAHISLERLSQHFRSTPLQLRTTAQSLLLSISFSAGLTEYREGESVPQLLERADKLCYAAKTRGRNRVESE